MKNLFVLPIFGETPLKYGLTWYRDTWLREIPCPLSRGVDRDRAEKEVVRALTEEWIRERTIEDVKEEVAVAQVVTEWSAWMASPDDAPPPLELLELFASRETLLYHKETAQGEKAPRAPKDRLLCAILSRVHDDSRPVNVDELMRHSIDRCLRALRDRRQVLERLKERIKEWGAVGSVLGEWHSLVCRPLGITRKAETTGESLPDIPSLRSFVEQLLTFFDQPDDIFQSRIRTLLQYIRGKVEDYRPEYEYECRRQEEAAKRPQPSSRYHERM